MVDPQPPSPKTPVGKKGPAAAAALVLLLMSTLLPHEGRKLAPYLDPPGIWTVCMGITGPAAHLHPGVKYTVEECKGLEKAYLTKMVDDMGKCIIDPVEEKMTYGEWTAYGHWAFNTGTGAFCNSSLNHKLNAGDHAGACRAMGNWTYITYRGRKRNCRDPDMVKVCSGIVKRRDYEVDMCLEAL